MIFTEYVQTGVLDIDSVTFCASLAVGLMATNVLIVNNYRDCDDDKAVGKNTTVVIFGRKTMSVAYLLNGIIAAICLSGAASRAPPDIRRMDSLRMLSPHTLVKPPHPERGGTQQSA